MKNIGLRVVSLVIAIFLTLYVNRESNSTNFSFLVGVEVKNPPKDRMIVHQSVSQVQITVSGPSYLVARIPESPPTMRVELPNDIGPYYRATLAEESLGLPPSIEIVAIEPKEIELGFDRRVSKTVPVVVNSKGAVRSDLKIQNVKSVPDSVEIVGPESEVRTITNAETSPAIDLSQLSESIVREVEIRVPARLTKAMQEKATVTLKIGSTDQERKLTGLPVQIRAVAGQTFSIKPTQVNVEVSGSSAAIEALKRTEVVPYVRPPEGDGWTGGEVNVGVDLPRDIELVAVEPNKLKMLPANIKAK